MRHGDGYLTPPDPPEICSHGPLELFFISSTLVLVLCRIYNSEFGDLILKLRCNSKINTYEAFVVIPGHVQSNEKFKSSNAHVPS